eukprot:7055530-Alexandrium_andersonii.AAC.1
MSLGTRVAAQSAIRGSVLSRMLAVLSTLVCGVSRYVQLAVVFSAISVHRCVQAVDRTPRAFADTGAVQGQFRGGERGS